MSALFALEFEWSDIENSLKANQNWRRPNSFWGKLSKVVFGRNRASQRAKIMNLWRENRTKIHHKFLSFSMSSKKWKKKVIVHKSKKFGEDKRKIEVISNHVNCPKVRFVKRV